MWKRIIESALHDLHVYLTDPECPWRGRENEVVNLFAHDFLAVQVSQSGPLASLSQVGIEVAVKQVDGSKNLVRKDLVIWPRPRMTQWSDEHGPAVIVEWKRDNVQKCDKDVDWLRKFTQAFPETIGFSVCAYLKKRAGVSCVVVEEGTPSRRMNTDNATWLTEQTE